MFELTNKVVLITGATGILGQGFCHMLAEHGAELALVDRNHDQLQQLADEISTKHPNARPLPLTCDITDSENVERIVTKAVSHFGRIDVLHSNAASKTDDLSRFFASYEEYSLQTWQEVMNVNIDGMFLVTKYVGSQMRQQPSGGSMILTSSIYGVSAPDQRIYEGSYYLGQQINTPAVYSASKAAVIGLMQYLAAYWGAHNIRVNCLTPGGIESGQNDLFQQKYSYRIPLGRMGKKDELYGALLFLASDASSYVTGQNIIIDGGLTCW